MVSCDRTSLPHTIGSLAPNRKQVLGEVVYREGRSHGQHVRASLWIKECPYI